MNGRLGRAHSAEGLFGGNAPVHHPGALDLSVLLLDALQKVTQGGLVQGIPGHDLIGERKTFRGHDQGDHHLHAIWTFVATVTEFPQTSFRWLRFEIGAGQIVEEHLEPHMEQRLPALPEVREEIPLMGQQPVQTPIQLVDLHETKIFAQEIAHRASFIPLPVQPPLAAWIDQAVTDQSLEHIQPTGPLSTDRQSIGPKLIQPQLIPKETGQPAGTPLPGTM